MSIMGIQYHSMGKSRVMVTPSKEYLNEVFDYDASSGTLVRKKTGKPAVHRSFAQERWRSMVMVGGIRFQHSRLVWAWHHGDPGDRQVDHVDRDRRNDRIENLRLATFSQNNANRRALKGYWKQGNRWVVRVMKDRKNHHGGCFATEEEAASAAKKLRLSLHGEFAVDMSKSESCGK
jgi:hypothetical protein